jgi:hypothetical protein
MASKLIDCSARTRACRVHNLVNAGSAIASLCSQECEHCTHECVRYVGARAN